MNDLQERIIVRKACISVKSEQGEKILVCVGATEDLGKRGVIVDDGKKIKRFNKVDDALKFLKDRGVSFEDRKRTTEFILEKLRAAEIIYDKFGFNSKISPPSLDIGIEKERYRRRKVQKIT